MVFRLPSFVPNGSTKDYAELIERHIQRFAPDFRDCILARSISSPLTLGCGERSFSNPGQFTSSQVSPVDYGNIAFRRCRRCGIP